MANIKVKDLNSTNTITSSNQLMVLTDDINNVVQNITLNKFNQNIISTDSNNGITQGTDGNLYVDNANSGVTAGTYQFPQNLTVNSKGKITSVQNGSPASVPIATTSQAGIVKPDGVTITVQNDGTISSSGDSLPSQTGNAGKVLTTDGTDASWGATSQIYPIIESYVNGSDGYNVYSNGYCEQWGTIAANLGTSGSVQFSKPYKDTDGFGIQQCSQYTNYGGNFSLTASSATGFSWSKVNTAVITYWKAQGYVNLQS